MKQGVTRQDLEDAGNVVSPNKQLYPAATSAPGTQTHLDFQAGDGFKSPVLRQSAAALKRNPK